MWLKASKQPLLPRRARLRVSEGWVANWARIVGVVDASRVHADFDGRLSTLVPRRARVLRVRALARCGNPQRRAHQAQG